MHKKEYMYLHKELRFLRPLRGAGLREVGPARGKSFLSRERAKISAVLSGAVFSFFGRSPNRVRSSLAKAAVRSSGRGGGIFTNFSKSAAARGQAQLFFISCLTGITSKKLFLAYGSFEAVAHMLSFRHVDSLYGEYLTFRDGVVVEAGFEPVDMEIRRQFRY